MAKKSPLTVVGPEITATSTTRKLGHHGRSLWNAVQSEYSISDAGSIETLMQICGASDRLEALSARIAEDGEIVRTKNGLKAHPGLREETALRAFIVRGLQRLGITIEAVKPVGRPPQGVGWSD